MVKTLYAFRFAELHYLCVELELVKEVEQLEGLSQYTILLSTFDYAKEPIKGMHNLTADTPSRLPVDNIIPEVDHTDALMVLSLTQSEIAGSSIVGNFPQDRELLKAIEAARPGY
ncbi:unnamed protein product [Lepeophtheirus salmonis]|uniref:(salmon louse) hypothetical protein n=1 Tax=Lepeophtheirus salmonis TaxID=72036 RepID=A0A7R8GZN6_LEPSM|nr:unnamed protein product [Lepeophtheirus salmonis]CAF2767481.1 unnamed protein product [Lepeophtheirus salmonis]